MQAAATLGNAEVEGATLHSGDLTFRPGRYAPRDLSIDIGTAGSTGMVLQTLHLPLACRAERPVRLVLTGGTFNTKAPSFPFLEESWRRYLALIGLPIALAMPSAGFFPRGGGQLDAWIEPGHARPLTLLDRGPLRTIRIVAGVANLRFRDIAARLAAQAEAPAGRAWIDP